MEYLEIVDEYGAPTGELATKDDCLTNGLLKRCSWVVLVCRERGILCQKRSESKELFPGFWDIFSAAGHIDPGESPLEGAQREIREEIGIEIPEEKLVFQAMFRSKMVLPQYNIINNELGYTYFVDWTDQEDIFSLTDGEVASLKWMQIEEIEKHLPDFIPHKRVFPCIIALAKEFF